MSVPLRSACLKKSLDKHLSISDFLLDLNNCIFTQTKELSWYLSMQLSNVSYEKSINDYPRLELQNANEFRALFKIPQSHPGIPLRAQGLPLLTICLLKPGTQSLVVNFPAHWLLIVTVDTWLSGWDGTGKSIALCWLITDFPADQNALIDDCSCGSSFSRAAVPVSDSRFFLSRTGPGYPTVSKRVGPSPKFGSQMFEPVVSALPPLPSTRWHCRPIF